MALTIRPYRPVRLFDVMDRVFDDPFFRNGFVSNTVDAFAIPLDVKATADEFVISAAIPGLKPEEVKVEVLENVVTLSGEVASEKSEEGDRWLLQERAYGKFSRSLKLPVDVDGAKAEAHVENGVLTLRLPKAEAAKPKAITVKAK
jgi:HSP20 family protein